MLTFEPDRSLLNPKFESYKLDAIDQDQVLARFKLEHPLTQSSAASKSPLSFQEVQSRIRHNHLVVGPSGQAVYVDAEWKVIRVTWDETAKQPCFHVLYELPRVVQSAGSDADGPHREYPSAAFVDKTTLLVSDGHGVLYALQFKQGETGQALLYNSYELKIPVGHHSSYASVPFRIHIVIPGKGGEPCIALLSSRHYHAYTEEESGQPTSTKREKKKSQYDIWAVTVDFNQVQQDQPLALDIKWHRRGEDVPSYVAYIESKAAFMLLSSTPYRSLSAPAPQTYEPTPDEIAPIPRANETVDSTPSAGPPKPPPYSWTQTTDSVTVAFALPSNTPKNAIRITLSPTTLSLFVQPNSAPTAAATVPLPRYALRKFWDGIRSPTSFWTFDREAEHAYGLLTLHLDKQHDGTRWPHVFADTPPDQEEVPETLDPSELWQIRESLEKYTTALQTGEDASGLGLGRGVPSLAEGEMDDEVDLDAGDALVVTWVGIDGSVPAWSAGEEVPVNVLATPLPVAGPRDPSLVVKNGLDGLVYDFNAQDEVIGWEHTATFCVLSFVLASKRDTRFVYHVSSKAVLAFESGARGLGSNVYIYRGTARPKDKTAKQAVLKVGDDSSGPLIGVGLLHIEGEGHLPPVLLCLCEREMAVIRNTL